MNTIEIKLRYELVNEAELPPFTAQLTKVSTKRIVDVYYDTPTRDLLKKGVFFRIRDSKKVDIKFNRACMLNSQLETQPYCEEHSYRLPLEATDLASFSDIVTTIGLKLSTSLEQCMEINKLSTHYIVDKVRTEYILDEFTIALDEVAHLGKFLEIELMAQTTEELEQVQGRMTEVLLPLSLKPLKTGYCTMILQKQNFDEYLQGRFILDEHKALRKRPLNERCFKRFEVVES